MNSGQKFSDFSARLRWLRERERMTQGEFADAIGIKNAGYISELERGVKKAPSKELLRKISSRFKVTIDWLESGQDIETFSGPLRVMEEPILVTTNYDALLEGAVGYSAAFRMALQLAPPDRLAAYIRELIEPGRKVETEVAEDILAELSRRLGVK